MSQVEIQTRSESHRSKWNGIHIFDSVSKARNAYLEDKSIFKISFEGTNEKDRFRFRPKYNNSKDKWNLESESRIMSLNSKYKNSNGTDLFWVNQTICISQEKKLELFKKLGYSIEDGYQDETYYPLYQQNKISLDDYYYYAMNSIQYPEDLMDSYCILEVFTDEEFVQKFCN